MGSSPPEDEGPGQELGQNGQRRKPRRADPPRWTEIASVPWMITPIVSQMLSEGQDPRGWGGGGRANAQGVQKRVLSLLATVQLCSVG